MPGRSGLNGTNMATIVRITNRSMAAFLTFKEGTLYFKRAFHHGRRVHSTENLKLTFISVIQRALCPQGLRRVTWFAMIDRHGLAKIALLITLVLFIAHFAIVMKYAVNIPYLDE